MDKEYIDREYYCNNICRCPGTECDKTKCPIWIAPAADVAPVVRCKDCKHYTEFDAHNCKRLEFHFCNKFGNITRESDFCSYGERREAFFATAAMMQEEDDHEKD